MSIVGQWQRILIGTSVSTPKIPARNQHSGAYIESTNEYLIFGGFNGFSFSPDFYSISMNSTTPRSASIAGPLQFEQRQMMAVTADDNYVYAHGGHMRVKTRQWTTLNTGPSARGDHCLEFDQPRNRLVLFGGSLGSEYYSDIWIFFIASNRWENFVSSSASRARRSHACAVNTQTATFYVHGGLAVQDGPISNLWELNMTTRKWGLIDAGQENVRFSGHAMKYSQSLNALLLIVGPAPTMFRLSLSNPQLGWVSFQATNTLSILRGVRDRRLFSTGFNSQTGDLFVFGGSENASTTTLLNDFWKIRIDSPVEAALTTISRTAERILASSTESTIESTVFPLSTTVFETIESTATMTQIDQSRAAPNSSNIQQSFLKQTNQFYVIAISTTFLLFTCFLCYWRYFKRQRSKRPTSTTISSITTTTTESIASYCTKPPETSCTTTTGTINFSNTTTYMTTASMTSTSMTTASTTPDFAEDDQTISITMASKELGLSVPAYLHFEYLTSVRERKVLARGGCGVVILADALDEKLRQYGDQVVVKQIILKKQEQQQQEGSLLLQVSEKDKQVFYQEVSLMEYFKSEKFIAKLLGYTTDPFCLIMKYYPMGSLKKFIQSARNRCKIHVRAFTRDIAYGLRALHLKGVVHNDLKPDNVLLEMYGGQPFCVLSDLGISQVITPQILKVGKFQVTLINGLSMAYAAPERILFFRRELGVGAIDREIVFSWDLYSLGMIYYELLTAQTVLYT